MREVNRLFFLFLVLLFSKTELSFSSIADLSARDGNRQFCASKGCHQHARQGPTGQTGPTGPTGPTGSIQTYITTVTNGTAAGSQIVDPGAPFIFNTIVSSNGNISYNPANGIFSIQDSGVYEITYGGRWISTEETQPVAAIAIGGMPIFGTQLNGDPDNDKASVGDWMSATYIFSITAPNTVSIVNDDLVMGSPIQLLDDSQVGLFGLTSTTFATIIKID